MVGIAIARLAVHTASGQTSGVLYFTTYHHSALYRLPYELTEGHFHAIGSPVLVARLPHADGVAFAPNGDALVGGQRSGFVEQVDPATGTFAKVPSGCPGSYLITLDPGKKVIWTAGIPGRLCSVPVDPLHRGMPHRLVGKDRALTCIAFTASGKAFYTTGVPNGLGNFGSIDLEKMTTRRYLTHVPAGHCLSFDPTTRTLYVFGGDTIYQIDAGNPGSVLSERTVPGTRFDSGTTDGHGVLFLASNYGQLVVIDDATSRRVGDRHDVVTDVFLHRYLDDVAPLAGPGAAPAKSTKWSLLFEGLGGLLFVGLTTAAMGSRQSRVTRPSWDLRRRESEGETRRAPVRRGRRS